jgi:hypothetical protein
MPALSDAELIETLQWFSLSFIQSKILTKSAIYYKYFNAGIAVPHLFLHIQETNAISFIEELNTLKEKHLIIEENNIIIPSFKSIQNYLMNHLNNADSDEIKTKKLERFSNIIKYFSSDTPHDFNTKSQHFQHAQEFESKFGLKNKFVLPPTTVDLPQRKLRFIHSQFVLKKITKPDSAYNNFINLFEAIQMTLQNIAGVDIIEFYSCDEKNRCAEEIRGYLTRNFDSIIIEYLFGTAFPKIKLKFVIEQADKTTGFDLKLILKIQQSELSVYGRILNSEINDSIIFFIWSTSHEMLQDF